jgi:norsolorinic acid ketoreductase
VEGFGLALASHLVRRPNTTLIATIRSSSTSTTELKALQVGTNSKLIIETLPVVSDTAADDLMSTLVNKYGITQLDIVIANAGHGDADSFKPILSTDLKALRENFEINALGPVKLFQATSKYLKKSPNPKFILVTAMLGSISGMQGPLTKAPTLAHGASKASASFFVRKAHFEHEEITTMAIAPG